MRFRCVCKSGSALSRKPSFIETHQNFNSNKKTYLLLTTWDRATKQQHFSSAQINQEESPLPSTNHLLNISSNTTDQVSVSLQCTNYQWLNWCVFIFHIKRFRIEVSMSSVFIYSIPALGSRESIACSSLFYTCIRHLPCRIPL